MPECKAPADGMTAWAKTRAELAKQFASRAETQDTIRRMLEFGDDYHGLTADLWKLLETSRARDPNAGARSLRARLEDLRAAFVDRLLQLYKGASALESTPELPWFGPWRLQQESHGGLVAATARCQHAAQHLGALLAAVAEDAFRGLVTALAGTDESAPPVRSLRELHNLWVECGEQAYARAAHREDFAAALVELLAANVELRGEQQRLTEAWSRANGLPTRSQVDAISDRLHQLHRCVLELENRDGRPARRTR